MQGRIVIAGGSGALGTHLVGRLLELGHEVVVLSRGRPRPGRAVYASWDARTVGDWIQHLNGAAAVVNLTGRSVDCIKTPDHCDEILRSRVESTLVLGEAVRRLDEPPPTWVQMSTAHLYGDPPSVVCDESSEPGYGLAPTVARAWEAAFEQAVLPTMRRVVLRTTFVIGRKGGAMRRLRPLARFGLGGTVGRGTQGMSWIHETDMTRLFLRGLTDPTMTGVYIASAPNPVSNAQFMRELRRAAGMPLGLPAPEILVRLAAPLILRTDPELALYGRYCIPRRLMDEGFTFEFPTLREAMADLFRRQNGPAK